MTTEHHAIPVARPAAMLLAAASAGLLVMGTVMRRISGLYPFDLPPAPYFVPAHGLLLYVLLPFAVSATSVMLVAPGFLLVVARARQATFADAVLKGFLTSFVIVAAIGLVVGRLSAQPGFSFAVALIAVTAVAWAVCAARGGSVLDAGPTRRRLLWFLAVPAMLVVALLPLLFWQDLNGDGLELLTMARSLDHYVVPRVPDGSVPGAGVGLTGAAYFVRPFFLLGGLTEAAARLGLMACAALLFIALVAAAEVDHKGRLGAADEALIALGIGVVVVALAYNDSYLPYSADPAAPALIDFLAATCIVAMLYALAAGERGLFLGFFMLGYLTRPSATLVCGFALISYLLIRRPLWRADVRTLLLGIASFVLIATIYERGVAAWLDWSLVEPAGEVGRRRLRYLSFGSWYKVAYLALPAGFVPLVGLGALRLQDPVARVWAATAVLYFAFFWFQAFTALHQYLPAALLAVMVFWRIVAGRAGRRRWRLAALAGSATALALSLPPTYALDRSHRRLAADIDFRVGNYHGGYEAYKEAFDSAWLLASLFPARHRMPERYFYAAPWVLVHYASAPARRLGRPNYLVLPIDQPAGQGWSLFEDNGRSNLWIGDAAKWQAQLTSPPSTDFRSRLLAAPRTTLNPGWGVPARAYDVDRHAATSAIVRRLRSLLPDPQT